MGLRNILFDHGFLQRPTIIVLDNVVIYSHRLQNSETAPIEGHRHVPAALDPRPSLQISPWRDDLEEQLYRLASGTTTRHAVHFRPINQTNCLIFTGFQIWNWVQPTYYFFEFSFCGRILCVWFQRVCINGTVGVRLSGWNQPSDDEKHVSWTMNIVWIVYVVSKCFLIQIEWFKLMFNNLKSKQY